MSSQPIVDNSTAEESSVVAIPPCMVEVTREQFWASVRAEKRDVMPSPGRRSTDWLLNGTTRRWGWMSTGYASGWNAKTRYALVREVHP